MQQLVLWFVAVMGLVVGASHILQSGSWARLYRFLHSCGRKGAIVNGLLALVPGLLIVAGYRVWTWPMVIVTALGWLLIAKGVLCLVAPDMALRSMERGSRTPAGFVVAGVALLAIGALACYGIWKSSPQPSAPSAICSDAFMRRAAKSGLFTSAPHSRKSPVQFFGNLKVSC